MDYSFVIRYDYIQLIKSKCELGKWQSSTYAQPLWLRHATDGNISLISCFSTLLQLWHTQEQELISHEIKNKWLGVSFILMTRCVYAHELRHVISKINIILFIFIFYIIEYKNMSNSIFCMNAELNYFCIWIW